MDCSKAVEILPLTYSANNTWGSAFDSPVVGFHDNRGPTTGAKGALYGSNRPGEMPSPSMIDS
jgi:hypothetical protein